MDVRVSLRFCQDHYQLLGMTESLNFNPQSYSFVKEAPAQVWRLFTGPVQGAHECQRVSARLAGLVETYLRHGYPIDDVRSK